MVAEPTDRARTRPAGVAADASRSARDKRQMILDAAIKVFARTGYHGSRVSDIAREAGIAYGLVYHYFKNKEEILDTIFSERWGGFIEVVDHIADSDTSTEEKLLSIAATVLNAYRLRGDWVKVLVFEIQRSPRFSRPEQMRAVGGLFRAIVRLLRVGQERGELRADLDPEITCAVFIGALELVVTSRVLGVMPVPGMGDDPVGEASSKGSEPGDKEYFLKVARSVVDVFLNGCAVSDPSRGPVES
jgi:TetR/AcrR family fatty acid metabolism transcriptional regulator